MEEIKDENGKKLIFRKILPIIFGIFSILEYLYFPNYDKEMLATPVYLYFLISLLAIYGMFFIMSFKNEKLSEKLAYKAPLFTFVFLLLTIYDLLTLKFAILPLPYFAWLDMIMNSMIADKGFLLESTLASLKLLFTGYFIGSIIGIT
ncbi:MAG: ABC transporter permease, partial [Anaerococcus sp.]|nr:ABC transporter permease [Anaerococcus sp.]